MRKGWGMLIAAALIAGAVFYLSNALTGCSQASSPGITTTTSTTSSSTTTTTTTATSTTLSSTTTTSTTSSTTTSTTTTTTTTVPGDVNGDGYADVIVGAYRATATDRGQAYLYYGGVYVNSSADKLFKGGAAGDYLGRSVAIAGDVNGDGYADVIVGADGADAGGSDRGQAYIYYGGSDMDNTADVTLSGVANDDYFGYSVAAAGDVNGDGYADVIVGAYGADAGGSNEGQAYIYYGGPSMDNTADVTMSGVANGDYLGYSVSGVGDVNEDDYADVMVGAYAVDAGGTDEGRAYLYLGGPGMDNTADVTMSRGVDYDYLGRSVAIAGDVNGDGYADLIAGADGADVGGTNEGQAYIYYGDAGMDNIVDVTTMADATLSGVANDDYFGYSVAAAGDVNGDGYEDVIVGAYGADAGGSDRGQAYIYYGGSNINNTVDVTMSGVANDDYFGYSVAGAGDVNGDGYEDVIVGAYYVDAGGTNRGQAYIYYGGAVVDNTADVTFNGIADNDYFGFAVGGAR